MIHLELTCRQCRHGHLIIVASRSSKSKYPKLMCSYCKLNYYLMTSDEYMQIFFDLVSQYSNVQFDAFLRDIVNFRVDTA